MQGIDLKRRGFNHAQTIILVFAVLVSISLLSASPVSAQQNVKHNVTVYFFYGEGCPHCELLKPIMAGFEQKYSELKVEYLEVWQNATNEELFTNMSEAYGGSPKGVPTVFIGGDAPIIGYAEGKTNIQIDQRIAGCIVNGCQDPKDILANFTASQGGSEPKKANLPIIILIVILVLIVLLVVMTLIFRSGGKKKKQKEI
jgi:thiol-disulfide isomerase/thioredoxin